MAFAACAINSPAQQDPGRSRGQAPAAPGRRHIDKKKEAKKRPPLLMEVGWTATLDSAASAAPATSDGRAFVPLDSDHVVALSLVSGEVEWTTEVEHAGAPAAGGDLVFVPDASGIIALDAATGAKKWAAPLSGKLSAPLVTVSGWLLAGTDQGQAVMLRAATGEVLWRQTLGAPFHVAPALSATTIYLLLDDRRVAARHLESGDPIWERKLRGKGTTLFALEDRLFVGADDKFFYCLAANNGKVKWRWRTGAPLIGTATVDDTSVYFVSLDNVLRALHWSDGQQQWKAALPLRPSGGPFLTGRLLLVPGQAAEVPAFQFVDGTTAGSAKLPAEPKWPPVLLPSSDQGPGRLLLVTGERQVVLMVPGLPPLPSKSYPGFPIRPPALPAGRSEAS